MSMVADDRPSSTSRDVPSDELDAVAETAYRTGFDDGVTAAKSAIAPKVDPDRVRLVATSAAKSSKAKQANRRRTNDVAIGEHVYTDEDIETALGHFRKHRKRLERDHFNQYVTIDLATGQMAVAGAATEAMRAYEHNFGPSKTLTIHIGTTR